MEALLSTFVVLFVVVDPIGLAPIFAGLTRGMERARQRRQAIRGTLLAGFILFAFFFSGDTLLRLLGVGLPAFRIAGGILLFLLAIDMIFARRSGLRSTTVREQAEAASKEDVSVFPLAFPLIAGPGALTTVLLMANARSSAVEFIGMLALLLLVLGMTLASLLSAPLIMRLLGETGANVISRLLGLVLAALAVQFVLDGIRESL
ncbi:MAG: MarC family protein [Gammaproteobacteria bacterium]|jgi:multiple antibiotic resistance protein|nr:MarC family protein [Gammaproteobacteria bacterium]